jgi:hypothetical protein
MNKAQNCQHISFLFDYLIKNTDIFSAYNKQKELSAEMYEKIDECLSLNLKLRMAEVNAT